MLLISLDETWLLLIRAHRPKLARQSEREASELWRGSWGLNRQTTRRPAEEERDEVASARTSVTLGAPCLLHFAGSAGAIAILSAPESADAASTMASADTTS